MSAAGSDRQGSDRPRLVSASANPHKAAEIGSLLEGLVELLPRPASVPDVVEDASTLEGNARLKAAAVCQATGLAAVSDDTGLFVDALEGEPGVDTAYYAGPNATYAENRAKLLSTLAGVADRRARFRTVVMVVHPDGTSLCVEGVCEGTIATEERGERGFGFDPLFIPLDGDGRTFSQMTEAEKNAISHRGRAFAALVDAIVTNREGRSPTG